jgi:hypothetical protein
VLGHEVAFMIVVVTVHGIGSQEAPSGLAASDGYADELHEGSRAHLGVALGDDPNRGAGCALTTTGTTTPSAQRPPNRSPRVLLAPDSLLVG